MIRICLVIICLLANIWVAIPSFAQPKLRGAQDYVPKVVYFSAFDDPNSEWVKKIYETIDFARPRIALEIEVVESSLVRSEIIKTIERRTLEGPGYDYAVIINYRGEAVDALKVLNRKRIKTILFNAGFSDEERTIVGKPREKFPFWIGEVTPDDYQAGYDLAEYLFREARQKKVNNSKIRVFGLGGVQRNYVAVQRNSGFQSAIEDNKDVELIHLTSGHWSKRAGLQKVSGMISRYGRPDVIWCANDDMAIGAIESLKQSNTPNGDVVVGGFDWTSSGLEYLSSGDLSASAGGHHLDLIYIFLLIKGHSLRQDFAYTPNGANIKTRLKILDNSNLNSLHMLGRNGKAQILTISKTLNWPSDVSTFATNRLEVEK